MSLRAAIYVRQSVKEDQGIAQQVRACRARLAAEEWTEVKVYDDNDTSATKDRGAGTAWDEMLAAIDAAEIDVVVATETTRLLRRVTDVLALTDRDVRVVTVRDGIDTSAMMGKAVLTILVALAQAEIEQKEARALPYRVARREEGHPWPGLVPFGYSWVPKLHRDERGTRYAIAPEEAEMIRYLSAELLADVKLGVVVAQMNQKGWTTREGARWTTTTARRVLLSPFQAALLPPKTPEGSKYDARAIDMTKCTQGAWEAILTPDAVLAARHILMDPARRSHDGNTRAKWMLTGIGKCGRCGAAIRKCTVRQAGEWVRGWRCTPGCFQRPAALIEAYITEAVVALLSAPGLLQWTPEPEADVEALRARLVVLNGERHEAETMWAEGDVSTTAYRARIAKLSPQIATARAALSAALQADPLAEIVTSEDVRGMWESLEEGRRRVILGALVSRIEVYPVGAGRKLNTLEEVAGTVTINWRRTEHRVSLDAARSAGKGARPLVPAEARDGIAAALQVS